MNLQQAIDAAKAMQEGAPGSGRALAELRQSMSASDFLQILLEADQLRSQLAANDMTLGAYINRERAMAVQIADLRSQLSAREAQLAQLRARNQQLEFDAAESKQRHANLVTELEQAESKLAAYDACLAQVREEMPTLDDLMMDLESICEFSRHNDYRFGYDLVANITGLISGLQRQEAANRNAIAIHLESIRRLKDDNARLTAANAEYTARHVEQVARIERLESALSAVESAAHSHFTHGRIVDFRASIDAARSALASQHQQNAKHVCGLEGFGPPADVCQACNNEEETHS